jgi:hypothetical protein
MNFGRQKYWHETSKRLETSDYTGKAVAQQGALSEGATLLQKPFTLFALVLKVPDWTKRVFRDRRSLCGKLLAS